MGRQGLDTFLAIVTAILGLATLAVILSKNANTVGVIGAVSKGLSDSIRAADGPITSAGGSLGDYNIG